MAMEVKAISGIEVVLLNVDRMMSSFERIWAYLRVLWLKVTVMERRSPEKRLFD